MEWVSSEVEMFYNMFNKVYSTLIMNKYPYVKKVFIDPISFNRVFVDIENTHNNVMVRMCADFLSEKYDSSSGSLGTDTSQFMTDLLKMVPGNEILQGRKMYAYLELNWAGDCEGLIRYTR